jgi:hypothetical protein
MTLYKKVHHHLHKDIGVFCNRNVEDMALSTIVTTKIKCHPPKAFFFVITIFKKIKIG